MDKFESKEYKPFAYTLTCIHKGKMVTSIPEKGFQVGFQTLQLKRYEVLLIKLLSVIGSRVLYSPCCDSSSEYTSIYSNCLTTDSVDMTNREAN